MSSIVVLKFLDISFKLTIMKKLSEGKNIEEIVPFNLKFTFFTRYLSVIIYPLSFLLATAL